jgi:hypothetical protein
MVDNSRIICTQRVVELAHPHGESAIFEAAQEYCRFDPSNHILADTFESQWRELITVN